MTDTSTIQEVIDFLHGIAPNNLQESYDNAGLIVGDSSQICRGVVTCLDSTEAVIDEAIKLGANLVVAHHPIVFSGLKQFTGETYIQRVVIKAIKNGISIFAIHTNLDNVHENGVNKKIADKIGLIDTKILSPKSTDDDTIGSGLIGNLDVEIGEMQFLQHLKNSMDVNAVKYTKLLGKPIKTVAVCGGSGSFLLNKAKQEKANIFITSDFKYHEFFDANSEIIIADIGHYESEQFTTYLIQEMISNNFRTFAAHCTKIVTNPVKYL